MLEFIQLMGLKRILVLVGLILYIVVIFVILCLPEKRNSPQGQDEFPCTNSDEDSPPTPQDAHYRTLSESDHSPSLKFEAPGSFNCFRRKKSRPTDPWDL